MRAQRILLTLATFSVMCVAPMCVAQSMGGRGQMGQPGMGQPGQPGQPGDMGSSNMPSTMSTDSGVNSDRIFVMKAAQGGMAEVTLGNLAQQNAASDSVKQFGERMVSDHSKANDELRQLAQQKGIAVPTGMSGKDKRLDKMLAAKQGPDFDKAYIHDMVKDHEQDIAEFRAEAENGNDPDVKAWAQKTLPTLEHHLAEAHKVAAEVGVHTGKERAGAMSSQQ